MEYNPQLLSVKFIYMVCVTEEMDNGCRYKEHNEVDCQGVVSVTDDSSFGRQKEERIRLVASDGMKPSNKIIQA